MNAEVTRIAEQIGKTGYFSLVWDSEDDCSAYQDVRQALEARGIPCVTVELDHYEVEQEVFYRNETVFYDPSRFEMTWVYYGPGYREEALRFRSEGWLRVAADAVTENGRVYFLRKKAS